MILPFLFQSCDDRYTPISRSFFSSQEFGRNEPLGNGVECWRGYYQSLRPTQMGLSLNIGRVLSQKKKKNTGRVVLVLNAFIYLIKPPLLAHSINGGSVHYIYICAHHLQVITTCHKLLWCLFLFSKNPLPHSLVHISFFSITLNASLCTVYDTLYLI